MFQSALTFFVLARSNLAKYISGWVQLNYPTKMGTLEEQLSFIRKKGLKLPTTLNGRAIPEEVELNSFECWIVRQWQDIGTSRINTDAGPQSISDTQILSYMQLMEEDLRLVDITLIKDTDRAFINELAVQRELNKE